MIGVILMTAFLLLLNSSCKQKVDNQIYYAHPRQLNGLEIIRKMVEDDKMRVSTYSYATDEVKIYQLDAGYYHDFTVGKIYNFTRDTSEKYIQ